MKRIAMTILLAAAISAAPVSGQEFHADYVAISPPHQPGAVFLPSVAADATDTEQWMTQNGVIGVRNVSRPTLVPVLPAGPSTGAAVIVAPGGGFLGLAIDHEGWQVARWLANHGIAAFVLKYRVLPTPRDNMQFRDENNAVRNGGKASFAPPGNTPDAALADGIAALRHVRANAAAYRVDPERVGFMGFSAGGFLTRSVVEKGGADAPAFAAPIYPSMAPMTVPAKAPPMFVLIAADDFLLQREKGLPLIESYRAAGAPIEFHLLANGGHGFGLAQGTAGKASEDWITLFHRWLGAIGMLGDAPPPQP
ncbi:alpha/beta hydrolase [Erythrobacter sp. WG]|uniref:alpha/beta hydrolase n=1 Tax=Erythrobacter sp. WG TaxID=2985510 RepID=UPI00227118A3|nr:alpha/beta hydrolase [Erythrobacter sp. WG]MCX9147422.1 alpha/beta hydrolase [Erythrobacter sp. WG]